MAGSRVIMVQAGDTEIEAEAVVVAGTEPNAGWTARAAARNVLDTFGAAQRATSEVARSTAGMIEAAARPDTVVVRFGLKFSASGG